MFSSSYSLLHFKPTQILHEPKDYIRFGFQGKGRKEDYFFSLEDIISLCHGKMGWTKDIQKFAQVEMRTTQFTQIGDKVKENEAKINTILHRDLKEVLLYCLGRKHYSYERKSSILSMFKMEEINLLCRVENEVVEMLYQRLPGTVKLNVPLGPYYIDCVWEDVNDKSLKLAIEIDEKDHEYYNQKDDMRRTQAITKAGYTLYRLSFPFRKTCDKIKKDSILKSVLKKGFSLVQN